MNEKAKKELTTRDQEVISKILSKSIEVLTKEEKGILSARRSYLTAEEIKTFKVGGKVENEPDAPVEDEVEDEVEEVVNEKEEEVDEGEGPDHGLLKKADLVAECEKRDIEVNKRATVAELVELLEADDKGELEDDEEEK